MCKATCSSDGGAQYEPKDIAGWRTPSIISPSAAKELYESLQFICAGKCRMGEDGKDYEGAIMGAEIIAMGAMLKALFPKEA